eukprot:927144-Amphidinium_carterae.1
MQKILHVIIGNSEESASCATPAIVLLSSHPESHLPSTRLLGRNTLASSAAALSRVPANQHPNILPCAVHAHVRSCWRCTHTHSEHCDANLAIVSKDLAVHLTSTELR